MATVDKRISPLTNKASWRARIRQKGLPDLTKSFTRKTDAKQWADQTEAAIVRGRFIPTMKAQRYSLKDVLELYEPEILEDLKDPYNRLRHLTSWRKELGELPLSELTSERIKNFRKKLRSKVSNATANRYVASLSAALTYAVKDLGWMEKNPALRIKRLKEPKNRTRFLSEKEFEDLIGACSSLHNYPEMLPIVLIAVTTGMRRSEILKLRWIDCDIASLRMIVRDSKNDELRSVPLVGPALEALKHWGKVRPLDSNALVFPSHTRSADNRLLDIDHAWRLIRSGAGLVNFRFHDLRHTAASYLAMSGAGLRDIGDILGHKSLSMTLKYSHLTDDHKRKTVSRMVDSYFGAQI